MISSKNARVKAHVVTSIEGKPTRGQFFVKSMIKGDHMALLEVHIQRGVSSPIHTHSHESLIYVVRGRLKTTIGTKTYILGPGDVCRHPSQVAHYVEALEETLFIEMKSPAGDVGRTFGV